MRCKTDWTVNSQNGVVTGYSREKGQNPHSHRIWLVSDAGERKSDVVDHAATNPAQFTIAFSQPITSVLGVEYDDLGGGGGGGRAIDVGAKTGAMKKAGKIRKPKLPRKAKTPKKTKAKRSRR